MNLFRTKHTMDLTQGPIFKKLLVFAAPIVFTNLLQQFYNAADTIVVGKFDGKIALAAVGSTGSVTSLLLNFFFGLSVGANVICSGYFGARKKDELRAAMQTALIIAAGAGIAVGLLGYVSSYRILEWMGSQPTVIDAAALYMRIIFLGSPMSLLYNFGASILRAHGDTQRPMYILMITGLVNLILNVVFVVVFHFGVVGVAVATVTSQTLSAVMVLAILYDPHGEFRLRFRDLHQTIAEPQRLVKGHAETGTLTHWSYWPSWPGIPCRPA